jgi:hypothetical protein
MKESPILDTLDTQYGSYQNYFDTITTKSSLNAPNETSSIETFELEKEEAISSSTLSTELKTINSDVINKRTAVDNYESSENKYTLSAKENRMEIDEDEQLEKEMEESIKRQMEIEKNNWDTIVEQYRSGNIPTNISGKRDTILSKKMQEEVELEKQKEVELKNQRRAELEEKRKKELEPEYQMEKEMKRIKKINQEKQVKIESKEHGMRKKVNEEWNQIIIKKQKEEQ